MTRLPRLRRTVLTTILLATTATACASRDAAHAEATMASTPPGVAPAPPMAEAADLLVGDGRFKAGFMAAAPGNAPAPPRPDASEGRKIVRTGHLELRIDAYETVRGKLDALLAASGGFIASAQVGHSDGRVTEATLVLRVPSSGYEDLTRQLSALGTVLAEGSSADDVTDQWVDVSARLANAKRLEGRLIELVATQAGNVTQLLEVEKELASVREQIELYEGRLHVLDDQVSLSTLTVQLATNVPFVASAPPTFRGDVDRTLAASWAGLRDVGRSLALGAVSVVPWLPLLAAALFGLRQARRRFRRRLPAARVEPPATT